MEVESRATVIKDVETGIIQLSDLSSGQNLL